MPRDPALPKLTDTQAIILSTAANRPENIALPLPNGLVGAAAKMAVAKMMEHGWLQEVDANLRRGEPLWRETGDCHGTTLVVTDAGLLAIGVERLGARALAKTLAAKPGPGPALLSATEETPKPVAIRAGTKQAQIISILQRPDGATIAEMVAATSWQPHTARAAISGALKKKLALPISSLKVEGRGTVYRLP
jgi:hypothetical protein